MKGREETTTQAQTTTAASKIMLRKFLFLSVISKD